MWHVVVRDTKHFDSTGDTLYCQHDVVWRHGNNDKVMMMNDQADCISQVYAIDSLQSQQLYALKPLMQDFKIPNAIAMQQEYYQYLVKEVASQPKPNSNDHRYYHSQKATLCPGSTTLTRLRH